MSHASGEDISPKSLGVLLSGLTGAIILGFYLTAHVGEVAVRSPYELRILTTWGIWVVLGAALFLSVLKVLKVRAPQHRTATEDSPLGDLVNEGLGKGSDWEVYEGEVKLNFDKATVLNLGGAKVRVDSGKGITLRPKVRSPPERKPLIPEA